MAKSDCESTALLSSVEQGSYGLNSNNKVVDANHDGACGNHDNNHPKGKSIGYLGSIAIAVNALAGPAVLQLPNQYQLSGLIPTTLALIAVATLSAFCSLHMANVVSQVPGNKHFDKAIEFSDTFSIFWNPTMFKVTQALFFLTVICLNVAAIIDCAEVVDSILGFHYKTYGYNPFKGEIMEWHHNPCTPTLTKTGSCDPFNDLDYYGQSLLTLGYIITAVAFLPPCLMDLKENSVCQIFGFAVLISCSLYFCWEFSSFDTLNLKHASLWGKEYGDMLGVILFNFTLALAIPAWLNEKKRHVQVNKVVVGSTFVSTLIYVCVGALGACSMSHVSVNMLSPMVSGAYGEGIQIAGSIFAFFIIGLDIPLFAVLARYNLTSSGLCSKRWANLIVVWIPWFTSWFFYQGDSVKSLLDWGGVLLTSAVAFVLPLSIALRVLRTTTMEGQVNVYFVKTSRSFQIQILKILIVGAIASVVAAIGGQILTDLRVVSFDTGIRGRRNHDIHHGHLDYGITNASHLNFLLQELEGNRSDLAPFSYVGNVNVTGLEVSWHEAKKSNRTHLVYKVDVVGGNQSELQSVLGLPVPSSSGHGMGKHSRIREKHPG